MQEPVEIRQGLESLPLKRETGRNLFSKVARVAKSLTLSVCFWWKKDALLASRLEPLSTFLEVSPADSISAICDSRLAI